MSISVDYIGRFGNNLFQYTYARLLALKSGYALTSNLPQGYFGNTPNPTGKIYRAKSDEDKIIIDDENRWLSYWPELTEKREYAVHGFFQRHDYYFPERETIRGFYDFKPVVQNKNDIVCHVRLSDYWQQGPRGTVLHPSYYTTILDAQRFDKLYIVTDSPNDEYLRIFNKYKHDIVSASPASDFRFITGFDRIIIGNSSFSWWSAFLSYPSKVWSPNVWLPVYNYSNTLKVFPGAKLEHAEYIPRADKTKHKVSFIIGYNESRSDLISGAIENINKHYFGSFDYEILACKLCDDGRYKRGQVFNIGVQQAEGDVVVLQDVDIRYLYPIDIIYYTDLMECGYLPFSHIAQIDDSGKIITAELRTKGYGACNFFRKGEFLRVNGFSNLFDGWGAEDTEMEYRAQFYRGNNVLGHVSHERFGEVKYVNINGINRRWNYTLLETRQQRVTAADGYFQTRADVKIVNDENVKTVLISNLRVCDDFKYKDFEQKYIKRAIESLTKPVLKRPHFLGGHYSRVTDPGLTIGITSFNRGGYLQNTIASLLQSDAVIKKILIQDDCSDEGGTIETLEELGADKKNEIMVNPVRCGSLYTTRALIDRMMYQDKRGFMVVCQDDVLFSSNWYYEVINICDLCYRSGTDWGILSLYNNFKQEPSPFWIMQNGHPGGCAWCVNKEMWKDYRVDNAIKAQAWLGHLSDFKICHWCQVNPIRPWAVAVTGKSYVQHVGELSTICDADQWKVKFIKTVTPYFSE